MEVEQHARKPRGGKAAMFSTTSSSGHWIRRSVAVQGGVSGTRDRFESPDRQNIMFKSFRISALARGYMSGADVIKVACLSCPRCLADLT